MAEVVAEGLAGAVVDAAEALLVAAGTAEDATTDVATLEAAEALLAEVAVLDEASVVAAAPADVEAAISEDATVVAAREVAGLVVAAEAVLGSACSTPLQALKASTHTRPQLNMPTNKHKCLLCFAPSAMFISYLGKSSCQCSFFLAALILLR